MANSLRQVGFEVINGTNLNLKQMNDKVREFGDKLKSSGGVGLFYYAGHGIQVNNRNYLIPVEAAIPREDEVDFNALNLDVVLRKMATANNGLNIVILDACRNNPFSRSWSRGEDEGGLAQISAPTGTFIAYATSPDRTASDGDGRNGLYTAQLLKFIKQPNLKIEEVFKQVTIAVDRTSGGKQTPWTSSSLRGEFYFNPANAKFPVSSISNKNNTNSISIKAGAVRKNKIGIEFVYIPPGDFMMGSTVEEVEEMIKEAQIRDEDRNSFLDETPKHKVWINEGFWMGKYEVTQAQWQAIMNDNPSNFKDCGKNCPVESVSWNDIQIFLKRLNAGNDGFEYNLPSEAQWEYSARAGTTTRFAFGDLLNTGQANLNGDYPFNSSGRNTSNDKDTIVPVGSYQPNAWGLYDMHGNVSEWCQDIYNKDYTNLPTDGSANLTIGKSMRRHVLRGGAWQSFAFTARSTGRTAFSDDYRYLNNGFRIVARVK